MSCESFCKCYSRCYFVVVDALNIRYTVTCNFASLVVRFGVSVGGSERWECPQCKASIILGSIS